ncbi:MAG: PilN domain-containing protein [Lachnospiraceae bacterium]|nr:PilN domain-containing protein [Lachnospiraceae bacterium]
MAERVLSIEVGYSLTKVCEVEVSGKAPKIFNSFVIPTPEGMVRDGAVDVNDEFVNQFLRMMTVKKIKTRKAIFTVSSNKIASREAVLPYLKDKQIQPAIRANLNEYFPVDVTQYVFAHSLLETMYDESAAPATEPVDAENKEEGVEENSKKKAKVAPKTPKGKPTGLKFLILAAPKQLIQSYERLAKSCNLDLETIDYNGNSIYQAAKEECKDGVQLIIKVDEKSSLLMVLENGVIALNRTISYGIDEAIDTLMQTTELGDASTYEKALEIARRKTVILSSFDDKNDVIDLDNETKDTKIKADKKAVTESLRTLVGGIIRVIDFYNSNHSTRPIEKMFVTGIGADFSGLSNLLTNESGLKIKNLTHLSGIDIEKVFKDVTYGEYVACIGASIAPLKWYPDKEEAKGKGGKSGGAMANVNTTLIAVCVLGVCLIGSVVMVLMTLLPYMKAKKLNDGYKKTIEELQPSYDVYQEFLAEKANVATLQLIDNETRNRNGQLLEFIETLEKDMPISFVLNSLESDTEKITLDATVTTKSEVAYIVDKLKDNPLFSDAEITSVSRIEAETGETTYGFNIDLFYAPYEDETMEESEGEGV